MISCRRLVPIRPIPRSLARKSLAFTKMPTVRKEIGLTDSERDVFEILQKTTKHFDLAVTLRCAGGWVRDKLLGKDSDDIDIAIDTMLGASFAEKVNSYLELQGETVNKVAVMETNPEQSKHLETARIKIHRMQIDLVNLRSETYTQHSRVPQMSFGTATEDAFRRDLTINSMFYNINEALVEDFTGKGMEDLRNGCIRTPLPPMETFLDDPLRVLRAVRFAARFSFELDAELKAAASGDVVIEAFEKKISRERIGAEVDGMFRGPDPVTAIQHLIDLKFFSSVFLLPHNVHVEDYGPSSVLMMGAAIKLLRMKTPQMELLPDQRRLYLLAALLIPVQMLKGPHVTGKGKRSFCPASSHVVWEGLKWRMKDGQDMEKLHQQVPELIKIYQQARDATSPSTAYSKNGSADERFADNRRVQLGLWMKQMKALWKIGILLAPLHTMVESFPLGIEVEDYPLHQFVMDWNKDGEPEDIMASKRVEFCHKLEAMIEEFELEDCWQMNPLVDGKTVMKELKIKKGGPVLGELLDLATKWQLAYPGGSSNECILFLKQHYHHLEKETVTCKN